MRKLLIISVCCIGVVMANGDELLVTQCGHFASKDKKTCIEISSVASNQIGFHVAWKGQIPAPNSGGTVEGTSSFQVKDTPVQSGKWAFCISQGGDVWFYDGKGAFAMLRDVAGNIEVLKNCSDPNLGAKAPESMKKWVKKKLRNTALEPTATALAVSTNK